MYYRIFICSFSEDHWLISSIKNSASEYLSVFEILGLFSRMTGPFTHQQCMSDPNSLHPCQNLVLSVFLILALMIYVIVVSLCSFNLDFPNINLGVESLYFLHR